MSLHLLVAAFIASTLISFITGYVLCLYNSTDDFHDHGLETGGEYEVNQTVQPRPEVELVEVQTEKE